MITAGVDVGSNSVRLLIAKVSGKEIVQTLYSERGITRLAANIANTGVLSTHGMEKTYELFKSFVENIKKYKVEKIFAAATSAVREAKNSAEFLQEAVNIGIPLVTVTGEQEAYHTYLGVVSSMQSFPKSCLIYDIGGGSTEFMYVKSGKLLYNISVPIGVVKLADKFKFSNASSDAQHLECVNYLTELFDETAKHMLKMGELEVLIGTAGSVNTIAAIDIGLRNYDGALVNGYILNSNKLFAMLERLSILSNDERLLVAGLEKGREDLIVPSIIIVQVIMSLFGKDTSHVSVYGLREGLTIAAADSGIMLPIKL